MNLLKRRGRGNAIGTESAVEKKKKNTFFFLFFLSWHASSLMERRGWQADCAHDRATYDVAGYWCHFFFYSPFSKAQRPSTLFPLLPSTNITRNWVEKYTQEKQALNASFGKEKKKRNKKHGSCCVDKLNDKKREKQTLIHTQGAKRQGYMRNEKQRTQSTTTTTTTKKKRTKTKEQWLEASGKLWQRASSSTELVQQ